MSDPTGSPGGQEDRSSIYVKFIDILFAVVIGQSFVLLSSPNGLAYWIATPSQNAVVILNTLLAYALVVTSWVGYHDSVGALPIKNVWRFVIDIVLLFMYYLTFVYVRSFASISIVLTFVFVLYLLWNVVRLFEYPESRREYRLHKRTGEAGIFAAVFAAIAYASNQFPDPRYEGIMLTVCMAIFIYYRCRFWGGPKSQKV